MDAKITLSFNEAIIIKAKAYAESQNISLSRLIEMLLSKITHHHYPTLEDYPISDWVKELSAGTNTYKPDSTNRKEMKAAFYESRVKKKYTHPANEAIQLVAEPTTEYRVKRGRKPSNKKGK
jgi:hypothetical protein